MQRAKSDYLAVAVCIAEGDDSSDGEPASAYVDSSDSCATSGEDEMGAGAVEDAGDTRAAGGWADCCGGIVGEYDVAAG